MGNDIVGVILAAGRGYRMFPFSTKYPKPLLPICNQPVLQYQIETMVELGISDIVIVIGHLGFEITRVFGDGKRFGARIRYVEQQEILGIAHAVGQLESYITSPFLLFLGDIFFDTQNLGNMLADADRYGAAAVLAVKEEDNPEAIRKNFAVILDDDGKVRRVIEKPRYTKNRLKGCGLYLFDRSVFDAIRRTPRTAMRDEYEITDSIQILIDDGGLVRASRVISSDINISYPDDLLLCNLMQLKKLGKGSVVGESCRIHTGTNIVNSVIGNHVVVENAIDIKNSVVFSDALVSTRSDLDRMIVTPEGTVDCRISGMSRAQGEAG